MAENCTVLEYVPNGLAFMDTNIQGACSGHGTCVPVELCACDDGWTGRSDIINTEGIDCQVNEYAVMGLWIFNILFTLVQFALGFPRFKARYVQFKKTQEQKKLQGITFGLWQNRALLACYVYSLIVFPGMLLFALLKLTMPEERIGVTPAVTIIFAVVRAGFYICVWLFQPALLSSLLAGSKNHEKMQKYVKISDYLSFALCVFAGIIGAAPIIGLFSDDQTGTARLVAWYLLNGGTTFQLTIYGVQSLLIKKKIIHVLDRSISMTSDNTRIVKIKTALVSMQNETIVQSAVQGFIYFTFAFFPFFYNKYDYFLPIGWLAYSVLGKKLAYTSVKADRGGSSASSYSSKSTESSKTNQAIASFNNPSPQDISFIEETEVEEVTTTNMEDTL